MTNILLLWETPDGARHWEALEKKQVSGFLEQLLTSGVSPASIIMAYNPIFLHWAFPSFHRDFSDVCFGQINESIAGCASEQPSKHVRVDVREDDEARFGWVAPDGRFFFCDYGGHISLAGKIVGELEKVADPEQYLEDHGWAKISSGKLHGKQFYIGMGVGKKLTDAQINALSRNGWDSSVDGLSQYL